MIATVTSKGQMTLPVGIRTKMDLHPGDKLDFIVDDNGVLEGMPVKCSLKSLKGMLPPTGKRVSIRDMEKAIAEGASGARD